MQVLTTLVFLFALGSMLGWVLEFFYRRAVGGVWVNPGFLRGPYLPIYGTGTVALYAFCILPLDFIALPWLAVVARILLMGCAMTAIEYVGGIVFVKGMNLQLWDYSNQWGNIQGVICPLFSAIWTAIGALYFFLLHDIFLAAATWYAAHVGFTFFVGMFYGVFLVDLVKTTELSLRIRRFAVEHGLVVRFEEFKEDVQKRLDGAKSKIHFFATFHTPAPIEDFLNTYFHKKAEKAEEQKKI